jgi:hypothetical protein
MSVRVAVVDSGLHPDHPHVGAVAGGVWITDQGEATDWVDRLGHGTAVAGAIREKAPEAEIYAVRVFDRRLSANIRAILRALDWCLRQQMDIINLSLGTQNPAHQAHFEEVLARAKAQGTMLISAATMMPGCLPGAIGVEVDWECPRDTMRERVENGRTIYMASGYPRPLPGLPVERNLSGISFAVANVSGFLAAARAKQNCSAA